MSKNIVKNTEKKVTVQEFVEKCNELTVEEIKDYIINEYIPYENKITICEKIVESTYYIKTQDVNGAEKKKLHINSAATFMLYRLNMINSYTLIDIDFKNSLKEYNLLNKSGLIDVIFKLIPENELSEFDMLLEMTKNDFIANEYETKAFISKQVERFGELFGIMVTPAFERLSEVIENMDNKTVDSITSKVKNIMDKLT